MVREICRRSASMRRLRSVSALSSATVSRPVAPTSAALKITSGMPLSMQVTSSVKSSNPSPVTVTVSRGLPVGSRPEQTEPAVSRKLISMGAELPGAPSMRAEPSYSTWPPGVCTVMSAAMPVFSVSTRKVLVSPREETSTFRVLTLNTGMAADITVQTPGGQVEYEGSARIDGAPGSSAPIEISFLDTAGSVCSGLLPTGKPRDTVTVTGEGFEDFTLDVTCIDNGMPLVIFKAADVGATGLETVAELNADTDLKRRIEALRLQISRTMGRSEEHTSELQSRQYLVCRLLLEKKKNQLDATQR